MVACSWQGEGPVSSQEAFFEGLWAGTCPDAVVRDVDAGLAREILEQLGPEYAKPSAKKAIPMAVSELLATAAEMPSNFFVSGAIPALYQHQERAVIDALSRWPVRVLLADEVGLGKTFEAAAVMAFLVRFCGVEKALILTPKAVLKQWQEELHEHFGIEAWLFDSSAKCYVAPDGRIKKIGSANPIGDKAPGIALMSAQYARGSGKQKSVFERAGAILPDLLVLDEAHAARVSTDLGGSPKATRLYNALENVAGKIPHVVLATATPMQKDAAEYHAILKVLGLPNALKKSRQYLTSLNLIASDGLPSTADAYTAGKILRSTAAMMRPSLDELEGDERAALAGLLEMPEEAERFEVSDYVGENWHVLKKTLVKLHPAHLLTVRNTRRSLEQVGYSFPKRNLVAEAIPDSADVQLFYMEVEDYIANRYFSVERALHPDKEMSVGFVRVSYQQRLASSLHSCEESVRRRFEKLKALKDALDAHPSSIADIGGLTGVSDLDELELDEDSSRGGELTEILGSVGDDVDLDDLLHATTLEMTELATLLKKARRLLDELGDLKLSQAIRIAERHLEVGDKVLLFSRYTDTVDALTSLFARHCGDGVPFGVYIGQKSVRVVGSTETPVTKSQMKKGLESGDIPIVFCSDAASEGLNLQAARVLINVDVPWTPARLEQRIGRVARLGQRAPEVEIYNLWYPNSVEAKMYARIQSRLDETNIAVGEFPEVVAEKILDSIVAGGDEDGVYEFQEIRGSVQARALSSLWSDRDPSKTTSRMIREKLMSICAEHFESEDAGNGSRVFRMHDGRLVQLSPDEGRPDSVSLSSLPWSQICDEVEGVSKLVDPEGRPAAYALDGYDNRWVDQEYVADLAAGGFLPECALTTGFPKMLPDMDALDLSYALKEVQVPAKPAFWPPRSKE